MILGTFTKQPADTTDYDLDYIDWLTAGDNVQSMVVTADAGITTSHFVADPRVKIWVSGGMAGATYKVTCTMTSADGRIRQDEFKIRCKEY